jgi:succinate dehydrogenase/fumarate reductase flavoprotein subunit
VIAVGGALTMASLTPGHASAAPQQWDHATDVLCVGSGAAASTAACIAAGRGAKVMMIEKLPVLGGTTSKSAGVMWIPNHYLLRQAGIVDERDDCLRYMARYAYPRVYNADSPTLGLEPLQYALLGALFDNGSKAVDALRDLGAMKWKEFRLDPNNQDTPDYADHLTENKVPARRTIEPDVETTSINNGSAGGVALVGLMQDWLRKKNTSILLETRAKRVIVENGRVVGLEAEQNGRTIRIRASKGVIFGTGGYAHNTDLVALHQPSLLGACARTGSTGDFLAIAEEAGAQMGSLGTAWRTQLLFEEAVVNRAIGLGVFYVPGDSMILVNKYGKRVVNEKRNYNDRTTIHFELDPTEGDYPNNLLFMVFDNRTLDAFGGAFPLPRDVREQPALITGNDWADLTRRLSERLAKYAAHTGGLTLAANFESTLTETVSRFNGFCQTGVDPDFGRGKHKYDHAYSDYFAPMREGTTYKPNPLANKLMYPIAEKGPYYAMILGAGALDTSGGPQTDDRAQVLGAAGKPIPGLFGAGNCIASPTGRAYFAGGSTLGPAVTFGYIAAMTATSVA